MRSAREFPSGSNTRMVTPTASRSAESPARAAPAAAANPAGQSVSDATAADKQEARAVAAESAPPAAPAANRAALVSAEACKPVLAAKPAWRAARPAHGWPDSALQFPVARMPPAAAYKPARAAVG